MQPRPHFRRKIHQIRIVVHADSELRLPHENSAIPALPHVQLDLFDYRGSQLAIDIAGNVPNYAVAVQCFPSCRK